MHRSWLFIRKMTEVAHTKDHVPPSHLGQNNQKSDSMRRSVRESEAAACPHDVMSSSMMYDLTGVSWRLLPLGCATECTQAQDSQGLLGRYRYTHFVCLGSE